MARGGLAGIWDRNKKWLAPVAEGAAGLFGGPLAAAGLGAAIGGFDRPGKGGIGFDVGQGLKGGVTGYGMGALGAGVGGLAGVGTGGVTGLAGAQQGMGQYSSGLSKLFTGGGAETAAAPGLPSVQPQAALSQSVAPAISSAPADYAVDTSFIPKPQSFMSKIGSAADWAGKHEKATSAALQGVGKFLPSAESRALEQKNQLSQQQFDFEKQQYENEQKRKQAMAQLLIPLYQQYAQQFGMKPLGGA